MAGYFETQRGVVQAWECDHMGHLNTTFYMQKFSEAGAQLTARIGLTRAYMDESGGGMAALEHIIKYRRELRAGDVTLVESGMIEVGNKTIRFLHRLLNATTLELSATMEGVACYFNRNTRKSEPLPDFMRATSLALIVERKDD